MRNLKGIRMLNKNEMKLVTGGSIALPMESKYRDKNMCQATARDLKFRGIVSGMSQTDIAKEIFAHAVAYYQPGKLNAIGRISSDAKQWLIAHGEEVNIADGGDTLSAAYTFIWTTFPDTI